MSKDEGKGPAKMSRRALLFGAVNRFKETGEVVTEKLRKQPAVPPERQEADRLLAAGDLPGAAMKYRECLARDPENPELRAKLGYALYKAGKDVQAQVEFTRVLRKQKHNLCSLYLGLSYCRVGNLPRAVEAWRGYFNPQEQNIMREINLQIAMIENGRTITPKDVLAEIEGAIERRRAELAKG